MQDIITVTKLIYNIVNNNVNKTAVTLYNNNRDKGNGAEQLQ